MIVEKQRCKDNNINFISNGIIIELSSWSIKTQ